MLARRSYPVTSQCHFPECGHLGKGRTPNFVWGDGLLFFQLENVKCLVECENQEKRVTVRRRQERTLQELRINPCLWLRLEFGPRFPYSWGWKQTTNVREWKLWPSSQSARVNECFRWNWTSVGAYFTGPHVRPWVIQQSWAQLRFYKRHRNPFRIDNSYITPPKLT